MECVWEGHFAVKANQYTEGETGNTRGRSEIWALSSDGGWVNWAFPFLANVQAALGSWLVQKFSSVMSETE